MKTVSAHRSQGEWSAMMLMIQDTEHRRRQREARLSGERMERLLSQTEGTRETFLWGDGY